MTTALDYGQKQTTVVLVPVQATTSRGSCSDGDTLFRRRVTTVDGSHGDGKPRRTGGSTMAAEVTVKLSQTPAKEQRPVYRRLRMSAGHVTSEAYGVWQLL